MKGLLGILLLLLAPQLLAGPFDPPSTDESVIFLGNIFGGMVGDIYLSGVGNSVFYSLIEKLNFTIIAGGALILTYVSVFSVIHTAHEGSILGATKTKWDVLWIPIRSIVGLSLMAPTPATGYSLIQVAVMWLVLQGIGIADLMWNLTLNSLSGGVSATTGTMTNPTLVTIGEQMVPDILNAALCMQSVLALQSPQGNSFVYTNGNIIHSFAIENTVPGPGGSTNYYTYGVDNNNIPYASVSGTVYFGIPGTNLPQPDAESLCGSIKIAAAVSLSEYPTSIQNQFIGTTATQPAAAAEAMLTGAAQQIYNTQLQAIAAMMGVLQPLAKGYATGEYASPNNSTSAVQQAPPGYTTAAANAYAQYMGTLVVPQAGQFSSTQTTAQTAPQANPFAGTVTEITQGASGAATSATTLINENPTAAGAVGGAAVGLATGGVIGAGLGAAVGAEAGNTSGSNTGTAVGSLITGAGQAAGAAVSQAGNAANAVSNFFTLNTAPMTDYSQATMAAIAAGAQAGWISAGSFYFILNRTFTSTLFKNATQPYNASNYNIPSCEDLTVGCLAAVSRYNLGIPDNAPYLNANLNPGADQTFVAENLADGYYYYKTDSTLQTSTSMPIKFTNAATSSLIGWIMDSFTAASTILNIMSGIFNGSAWNEDPLLAHAIFGQQIMLACEGMWTGIAGFALLTFPKMFFPNMELGTIATWSLSLGVTGILIPFVGTMWAMGALLAIYMPLIPFMFFALGALGWFLQVVEALIAAPMIAVGLLMPGGEALGHSHGALSILANILLRPVMMIFGFLFACKVYRAIVQLIDSGMGPVLQTINVETLFSVVVVVSVYVTFTLSATNVCFALIYELPNKILRWLTGHQEQLEIGDTEEAKHATETSGKLVGGFLQKSASWALERSQGTLAKAAQNRLRGGNNDPSGGGREP